MGKTDILIQHDREIEEISRHIQHIYQRLDKLEGKNKELMEEDGRPEDTDTDYT